MRLLLQMRDRLTAGGNHQPVLRGGDRGEAPRLLVSGLELRGDFGHVLALILGHAEFDFAWLARSV